MNKFNKMFCQNIVLNFHSDLKIKGIILLITGSKAGGAIKYHNCQLIFHITEKEFGPTLLNSATVEGFQA